MAPSPIESGEIPVILNDGVELRPSRSQEWADTRRLEHARGAIEFEHPAKGFVA